MLTRRDRLGSLGRLLARCGVVLGAVGIASVLLAQSDAPALPFAVKWWYVKEPQLIAREMEKVQQGTLYALPLEDLESRLDRARKAAPSRRQKPRLLRAHYSAELIDHSLSNGSGQWSIMNPAAADEVLPIDKLNLALHQMKWEQGGDVVLGELDSTRLGLLLKEPGNQTCFFDWSARGTPTNEGFSFHLQIPTCAITTFEIKLPADLWLSVPKSAAIVSGPHDTESPAKRSWRIQVTAQTDLDLILRRIADAKGAAPTIFAQVSSYQQVSANHAFMDYEFNVDVLHGGVRELVLEGDAVLQPYDVILKSGDVQTWHWQELPAKTDPRSKQAGRPTGVLKIFFRQPVQGKINGLRIRALADAPPSNVWASPALRVRDAISRGETLKVQVRPHLPLGTWDNGTFRPTDIVTETDGTQLLTLAEAAPEAASTRRPSVSLQPEAFDLYSRETNRWRLDARNAVLEAEWDFTLLRGTLSQLAVKLPDKFLGYQVEAFDVQPAEIFRDRHVAGKLLIVELKQPLIMQRKVTLKMRLRAPLREIPPGGRLIRYPQMEPTDSTKREGTLAIAVAPAFQSHLVQSSLPLARIADAAAGKDRESPSYLFAFRDQSISANLRLVPQPMQVQLRGKQTVVLSEEGAALQYHWEIAPRLGSPGYLDFRCSEGFVPSLGADAQEDSVHIHRWERLHLDEALPHLLQLGCRSGLEFAALARGLPSGSLWRIHFSKPIEKKASFTLAAHLPAVRPQDELQRVGLCLPSANSWEMIGRALATEVSSRNKGPKAWSIPLMIPAQRSQFEQDIAVESAHEPIVKAASTGLRLSSPLPSKPESVPVHSLLYHVDGSAGSDPPRLRLWTHTDKTAASMNELCDEATLVTTVHADGRATHRLQFRLWHWRDRTCTIRFSPALHIVAAKVNQRWLEWPDVRKQRDGVSVVLPVDQNAPFVRCEIHATSATEPSFLPAVASLAKPQVELPVNPMDFRRRYCLADGLAPLHQETLVSVGRAPGAGPHSSLSGWFADIWSWGSAWLVPADRPILVAKWVPDKQREQAADGTPRAATMPQQTRFSHALQRLALEFTKQNLPLFIDRPAFESLGLAPTTKIASSALNAPSGRPFWETLGLICIETQSGALLTTPRRWETMASPGPANFTPLALMMREALLHGRDSSTTITLAMLWAERSGTPDATWLDGPSTVAAWGASEGESNDSTEWLVAPGAAPSERLYFVDTSSGTLFSWVLALAAAALIGTLHRFYAPLSCLRAYLLLLAGGVLAVFWLPLTLLDLWVLPMVVVEVAALLWFLLTLTQRRRSSEATGHSTLIKPATQAAVLGFLLMGLPWIGTAQMTAPPEYKVLVVDSAKPLALIPLELKAKLEELEKAPASTLRHAVLLSANYRGQVKEQTATFEAQYELYSPTENASLVVPLQGVQLLEGAFLDGSPAFPTTHKNGFLFTIRNKGRHHLRLVFAVRATALGTYSDLRFTAPKVPQSQLSLEWSAPVQSVVGLHAWGEEKSIVGPRPGIKEWRVQLGYENSVHLRWSAAAPAALFKSIEVHEMHYWDLRSPAVALFSSFKYAIDKGSIAQIVVALPEGLHVRSAEATQPAQAGAVPIPVMVKSWQVLGKGAQRRLLLNLLQPVTNQLTLNLEIVPHLSLHAKQVLLPLPAPLQGKSILGQLGYRIDLPELRSTAQNLAVQGMSAADFAALWKKQAAPGAPLATRAYSFQRKGTQAGLELVLQPLDRQAQMDLAWTLDAHRADVSAKVAVTGAFGNMILQEFFVAPAIVVANVRGAEVGRWSVQGNRLQIWFRRPCQQADLEISGWLRPGKQPFAGRKEGLALPSLHPLQIRPALATLTVKPAPGIALRADRLNRLRPIDAAAFHYAIDDFPYEASFHVTPNIGTPDAELLTTVQRTGSGIETSIGVRLLTERGSLPPLTLQVSNWPGAVPVVEAAGAVVQPGKKNTPSHAAWTIKYPPGLPHEIYFTLRGQAAKNPRDPIAVPVVELGNAHIRARWIGWREMEIVDAQTGNAVVKPAPITPTLHFFGQDVSVDPAAGWKHAALQGSVKAVLPKKSARPKVVVLGSTGQARIVERSRWLHEADQWLQVLEPARMRLVFATPADRVCVFVDGQLHTSQSSPPNEYFLPLPVRPRPQHVRVCWTYRPGAETLQNPRLESPLLDRGPAAARQHILWVPASMTFPAKKWDLQPTLLERLAHQAEIQVRLAAALPYEPGALPIDQVKIHQRQFHALLRLCEYELANVRSQLEKPDLPAWQRRLTQLRKENLRIAKEHGYDRWAKPAPESSSLPLALSTSEEGEPSLPVVLTVDAPRGPVQLVPSHADREARTRSELVLLIFISLLIVSFFRHSLAIVHTLVPEIVAALALIGMWFFGLGLIGLVAVALMLAWRTFRIFTALAIRWQNRRHQQEAVSDSAPPPSAPPG